MKVIVSHDVDHITVWEHLFRDTILPKFMVRMHIELITGKISAREYLLRWADFFRNKWENIDELITYNKIAGVPSSFFIAVERGLGLNYSNDAALLWIRQMQLRQCEIGLHGLEFLNAEKIMLEHATFSNLTGQSAFGIRMHYMRQNTHTLQRLAAAGYRYDSTTRDFRNPYRIGSMWEFPVQIMDGWIIEKHKSWQTTNLEQAKQATLQVLDRCYEAGLDTICVDFHDRYFSNAFKTWLEWYMWLVDHLKSMGAQFVNFSQAIELLETDNS